MPHAGSDKIVWRAQSSYPAGLPQLYEPAARFAEKIEKLTDGKLAVKMSPGGAPGMPEMLTPTDAIKGAGYKKVALITDGRFSGATTGPCIGHVEMEAYNGGAIGAIRNGDIIEIDIPKRKLHLRLSDKEIQERLKKPEIPDRKLTPFLTSYRKKYTSINCYGK